MGLLASGGQCAFGERLREGLLLPEPGPAAREARAVFIFVDFVGNDSEASRACEADRQNVALSDPGANVAFARSNPPFNLVGLAGFGDHDLAGIVSAAGVASAARVSPSDFEFFDFVAPFSVVVLFGGRWFAAST